jgi:hypothetical protein
LPPHMKGRDVCISQFVVSDSHYAELPNLLEYRFNSLYYFINKADFRVIPSEECSRSLFPRSSKFSSASIPIYLEPTRLVTESNGIINTSFGPSVLMGPIQPEELLSALVDYLGGEVKQVIGKSLLLLAWISPVAATAQCKMSQSRWCSHRKFQARLLILLCQKHGHHFIVGTPCCPLLDKVSNLWRVSKKMYYRWLLY